MRKPQNTPQPRHDQVERASADPVGEGGRQPHVAKDAGTPGGDGKGDQRPPALGDLVGVQVRDQQVIETGVAGGLAHPQADAAQDAAPVGPDDLRQRRLEDLALALTSSRTGDSGTFARMISPRSPGGCWPGTGRATPSPGRRHADEEPRLARRRPRGKSGMDDPVKPPSHGADGARRRS